MTNEDFAKRAKELGHGIISTMEHGWQGRYIEGYELAAKYGLKFVFGTEAYWVKDRTEADRSNCHICIFARNESGRQAINDILAEANITGYYYQPRLDIELIKSLPENDVIITTACLAYWKYEDIDKITLDLYEKFKGNFYLEVQYHNTDKQRKINRHVLELHDKYNIPLIMGCDSHYIKEEQSIERDSFIYAKGIDYPDEEGWYMDYPDGETAYKRFANQCVLDHDEIIEAMQNTNVFLEVEEYECPCFNTEVKMPSIYPELSQEEKDQLYSDIIWAAWEEYKWERPEYTWEKYIKEIQKEIDIVHATKHSDYFLLNREVIETGKAKGGTLTASGRGSAVSFVTNKLLGFTDVDRVAAKVHMYPERFMSVDRIIEAKTLADIDFNVANQEPFAEAQQEILGYEHAFPMIAYQTAGPPAAWKMYAKSQDVDFETANAISNQIKRWQKAVAHADDDVKDDIDIYDYIDRQYHDIYDKSKEYLGIITSVSPHSCSYLLYQGDIRKEIGLIYLKPKGSKEGRICCLMDGHWAEDYKFLKNDLLKVNVVELIAETYKRAGVKMPTVNELLEICTPDNPVWDIYSKQCTLGINQVEQPGTSSRVAVYKPKNISELCAFIAAIRPGFKSMYKIFESRKHFDYGLPSFDNLIQTEEMDSSFVLYQEMIMATLHYAGIPMGQCNTAIKDISKKRAEKVKKYKDIFMPGFSKKIIDIEGKSEDEANVAATKVWQILDDSTKYSFNASHAYCVSLDSLHGAHAKTNYPLEFYETYLRIMSKKGNKDKMAEAKAEAEAYFGIHFPPFKFGQDNREIVLDKETNSINNTMAAIKGYSKSVAEILYQCSKEADDNFLDIIRWLNEHSIKTAKIMPLIEIGYFEEYGNIPTLKEIVRIYDELKQGKAKKVLISKIDNQSYLRFIPQFSSCKKKDGSIAKHYTIRDMKGLLDTIVNEIYKESLPDVSYKQKIDWQEEHLGYIDLTTGKKEDVMKLFVSDVFQLKSKTDQSVWAYILKTKSIATGKSSSMTLMRRDYQMQPVTKSDIIEVISYHQNKKKYWYLDTYRVIK